MHDFIFNKEGNLLSEGYVLFKCNVLNDEIVFDDIMIFSSVNIVDNNDQYVSMDKFWEAKIDYLERQLSEMSSSHLINNSFE